jgi:hypothetical protein
VRYLPGEVGHISKPPAGELTLRNAYI